MLNKHNIIELLTSISGVDNVKPSVDISKSQMTSILIAMEYIFYQKDGKYGNFLDNADSEEKVALFEHYIMVKRKYSRLATYSKARLKGEELPLDGVLDTYLDLAIYSAMGVLLVLTLMEKLDEKSRVSST